MAHTAETRRRELIKQLEKRREWLKENGPCRNCGTHENLQVDHTDPKTKVDHRVWSWSESRRIAELVKCQVLCKNCHQTKTRTDCNYFKHPSRQRYNDGCRCEECRKLVRDDKRRWRERKKTVAAEPDGEALGS